jgi:arylsulfatase A
MGCLPGLLTLLLLAPAAAAEAGAGPAGRLPPRPNVILILADDFGYECVAANGGSTYRTPNLDRLAREGMRFEHCYAQPLCTPTRVQLLTGLYNQRNYLRFEYLDPGERTFAQALQRAGYRTCVAGKWQLGGGTDAPSRFGFEEHLLWHLTDLAPRYANPVFEKDGRRIEHRNGEYGPDLMAAFAADFVRRPREEPFLLYYPLILTHPPFEPTPDSPDYDPRNRKPQTGRGDPRHFPAMVAYADKVVGRILEVLDETRLRGKTLVIFTADNGSPGAVRSRLGDREVRGGKGEMTDAGTRVPLIVSWPGFVPEGAACGDLIDSTDFFPTILEAAGVAPPVDLRLDGRSFYPQLRGEKGRPREWVYSWFSRDGGPAGRESARDRRYKLYGDGRFFDVPSDPEESRDLSGTALSAEAAGARGRLAKVLESFRGTRRGGEAGRPEPVAAPADRDAAVRRIEELGGLIVRKDGRIVEVNLNRRAVPDEALRAVAALGDLTDLSLEEAPVGDAGLEHLAVLRNLEWLNLYRTRVGDAGLAHLSRISSLKHLPVGGTRVTDAGLIHLERMPQLEYLGLRGDRITDAGLAHLSKLRRLKGLHLGETTVGDAGLASLAGLKQLEKLWLDRTRITDAAVEPLARLRSLEELHVAGTGLTRAGIEALRAALPGCEVETED